MTSVDVLIPTRNRPVELAGHRDFLLRQADARYVWRDLPVEHAGEDVAAQWRVMARYGGAGVLPSGAIHLEAPTTVPNREVQATDLLIRLSADGGTSRDRRTAGHADDLGGDVAGFPRGEEDVAGRHLGGLGRSSDGCLLAEGGHLRS
jgi:hypothetical protein